MTGVQTCALPIYALVQAARAIRNETGADIPMVLCSACDPSLAAGIQAECQSVAYLSKPYVQTAVLDVIQKYAVSRSSSTS